MRNGNRSTSGPDKYTTFVFVPAQNEAWAAYCTSREKKALNRPRPQEAKLAKGHIATHPQESSYAK